MQFANIKPYIRFARYLTVTSNSEYPEFIPYDARLFYVIQGNSKIEADGKEYEMEKGSLIIINAGIKYKLCNPSNDVTYLAVNFDFDFENSAIKTPVAPELSSNFKNEKIISKTYFEDNAIFNRAVFIKFFPAVEKDLKTIEYEYSRKIYMYESYIGSLFLKILTLCARKVYMDSYFQSNNEKTEKILNFVHENYKDNISNEFLGKIFGFHPNYISSQIKSYTGMSLHKYLLHVRLLHAVDMLEHEKCSIGEVAEKCGFCDIYYFSAYFKKEFGVSPSKYKCI